MKFLWIGFTVLACVVCVLLGLTLGIQLNPSSTIKFVPAWGSVGDWVAGLGSLVAVAATVVLANRERNDQKESVRVEVGSQPEVPWQGRRLISISITCTGPRPVRIYGISVRSQKHELSLEFIEFVEGELPANLTYGEVANFALYPGTEKQIQHFVLSNCDACFEALQLQVTTSMRTFEVKFPARLLKLNQQRSIG
ncbi:MAG: hypothetical protein KID08_20260 [Pseudomonas putida]|nr:hypothetical protein [Pseudomonas putida]